MQITTAHRSAHTPDEVWATIADVAAWPEHCPTVIESGLDGELAPGTPLRFIAHEVRPATWLIDGVTPDRELTWRTSGPGIEMRARYLIDAGESDGASGCTVRLSWTVTGPMSWGAGLILRRPVRLVLRELAVYFSTGKLAA